MTDTLNIDGLKVGPCMVRGYIDRIAELEAHNEQLLADKEASPAIIAGYRERGEQLLARIAELEHENACLKQQLKSYFLTRNEIEK